MKNILSALVLLSLLAMPTLTIQAQTPPTGMISVSWEELTSADFVKATHLSQGLCILPMGVVEKHGQHLPLGTDVFIARELSLLAARTEYAVVFPFWYAGQIFEARHQPGTISYSPELLFRLLDETCREISRNGFKKILLVNGHGGNTNLIQYFCQTQLESERDYFVYFFNAELDPETNLRIRAMRKSTTGGHADEVESSQMAYIRPDLTHIDRATSDSGEDLNRLPLPGAYTGIWWYAKYPNHYAGDAKDANPELGQYVMEKRVEKLAEVIRMIKADTTTRHLQNRFYREATSH
ncbi:MAG: creatininase family protein [Bacteroidales bacterium]|jgi:creatinine amidohydrolase